MASENVLPICIKNLWFGIKMNTGNKKTRFYIWKIKHRVKRSNKTQYSLFSDNFDPVYILITSFWLCGCGFRNDPMIFIIFGLSMKKPWWETVRMKLESDQFVCDRAVEKNL